MKRLESMKESLINCVMGQMGDLRNVDTKELGEAIDMIKDLSEAMYYCTITEAMEGYEEEPKHEIHYYKEPRWNKGGNRYDLTPTDHHSGNYPYYAEREYVIPDMRDPREGRSHLSRKTYMEAKEMGRDKLGSIQDLEKYMNELSSDLTEMIEKASVEEKQLLQKKLTTLAQKIISG